MKYVNVSDAPHLPSTHFSADSGRNRFHLPARKVSGTASMAQIKEATRSREYHPVKITIVKISDVPKDWFLSQDPYVTLWIGLGYSFNSQPYCRTHFVKDATDPVFDFTCPFEYEDFVAKGKVRFWATVMDKDDVTMDDHVGRIKDDDDSVIEITPGKAPDITKEFKLWRRLNVDPHDT